MIRIVFADDHPLFRVGIRAILDGAQDIQVVAEAEDGTEVMVLVRAGGFDVLILDMSMPGRSGLDLIRQVHSEAPKVAILVLTLHDEKQYSVRAIQAGALGYLTKDGAAADLLTAIRLVASGKRYLNAKALEQLALSALASNAVTHKDLTDREYEVFIRIVSGKSNTEIGDEMHMSHKTASGHRVRIMKKMRMTLPEMVQYAVSHQLLPPADI